MGPRLGFSDLVEESAERQKLGGALEATCQQVLFQLNTPAQHGLLPPSPLPQSLLQVPPHSKLFATASSKLVTSTPKPWTLDPQP